MIMKLLMKFKKIYELWVFMLSKIMETHTSMGTLQMTCNAATICSKPRQAHDVRELIFHLYFELLGVSTCKIHNENKTTCISW